MTQSPKDVDVQCDGGFVEEDVVVELEQVVKLPYSANIEARQGSAYFAADDTFVASNVWLHSKITGEGLVHIASGTEEEV
jgi:hypothetical protein